MNQNKTEYQNKMNHAGIAAYNVIRLLYAEAV